jgi:hypothetical protein
MLIYSKLNSTLPSKTLNAGRPDGIAQQQEETDNVM